MKFVRIMAAVGAASLLAACTGQGGLRNYNTLIPPSSSGGPDAAHAHSWMSPHAKGAALAYVSDYNNGVVYAYSYPGGQLMGAIYGSGPRGMCKNMAGQLWITYGGGTVKLYAPGGWLPIKSLLVKGYDPLGCAVNPKTGDLAVSNLNGTKGGRGSITIFTNANGKGKSFIDSAIYYFDFVAYDASGNLFADGQDNGNPKKFQLARFSGGKFAAITIKGATINAPGGLQFFYKDLTVGDQAAASGASVIYRMSESGHVIGKTVLSGSADCVQYFIYQSAVVCPNASGPNATIYKYPAGGSPTQTLPGSFALPIGSVITT
ncbi:MAG: hypothetical protein JOY69_04430 [Candidatus Eremiobacteraeota bacterium]|nr:hypothetical protein [Candidatus Eremiobacteraeota bacterium]